MKEMSFSEMITYSTVLIHCKYSNGTCGSGTGFIINLNSDKETKMCVPVLITNNHVINDSIETEFEFCLADDSGNPIDQQSFLIAAYKGNDWIRHKDPSIDLCCLPIAPVINSLKSKNIDIFYIPLDTSLIPNSDILSNLSAMEDIVMVGYPIGLSDSYNHKPVIRKGITATHPNKDYLGKKQILIDMACFPGSSGSPVFILNQGAYSINQGIALGNRIFLLGVLYAGPQHSAQGTITFANLPNVPNLITKIPINLGIIIKSEKILDFESFFQEKLEEQTNEQDEI